MRLKLQLIGVIVMLGWVCVFAMGPTKPIEGRGITPPGETIKALVWHPGGAFLAGLALGMVYWPRFVSGTGAYSVAGAFIALTGGILAACYPNGPDTPVTDFGTVIKTIAETYAPALLVLGVAAGRIVWPVSEHPLID